jgi:putative nucleotidyltransferase with HDIG domain
LRDRLLTLVVVSALPVLALLLSARLITALVAIEPVPILLTSFWLLAFAVFVGWIAMQRITRPLRRLAATLSRMAPTGRIDSSFETSGGGSREVLQIERSFRTLALSLEDLQSTRERSYVEAMGAMMAAADARDHETTGHSFRVASYALALAKALGVDGGHLQAIEWGSLLHDVGKMVVPDDILRKDGPLTPREWRVMRQHPSWGYDILSDVSFLQPESLDIIYSHHERWDGQGYPRGLSGREIPLGARIFSVVDTFDAITSDRPYRRARSYQHAIRELRLVAGRQLDPEIVDRFQEIPEVELRRLREGCRHLHPGLTTSEEFLGTLIDEPLPLLAETRGS